MKNAATLTSRKLASLNFSVGPPIVGLEIPGVAPGANDQLVPNPCLADGILPLAPYETGGPSPKARGVGMNADDTTHGVMEGEYPPFFRLHHVGVLVIENIDHNYSFYSFCRHESPLYPYGLQAHLFTFVYRRPSNH